MCISHKRLFGTFYMFHIRALRNIYSYVTNQQMHTDPCTISVHLLVSCVKWSVWNSCSTAIVEGVCHYVIKVAMKPSVIIWESRAVGQAVKRRLYTVEPAFQSRVTFSEIRGAWTDDTGARLASELCLFSAADHASVSSCSSVTASLRCAIPLIRQNPPSSLAENVGYREKSCWQFVLISITDNY
jgi:hypothetical protein